MQLRQRLLEDRPGAPQVAGLGQIGTALGRHDGRGLPVQPRFHPAQPLGSPRGIAAVREHRRALAGDPEREPVGPLLGILVADRPRELGDDSRDGIQVGHPFDELAGLDPQGGQLTQGP